ncbi:hypothetical protein I4U23_004921 [Adineta vaga]|nr:hypothetical protein I4U23_004921 [Adineta vaga]
MGNKSSKANESTPESNGCDGCSNTTRKRMAHGAFMAMNPAGALIAKAIRSSKSSNQNNTTDSMTNDEF